MCPRRDNGAASAKRQERDARQQEKKSREKKTYLRKDENAGAFNTQLRAFNLQLRNIVGDGNCLFRSFADQLDGDQHRHAYYRRKICDFMQANREDFEPFIVDQSFDAFVRSLSQDGTFGGNECLVAFSRLFDARICIHQLNQPVWTVCFSDPPKHEIHISYHNYEHYSSVRRLGDQTSASANIRQAMTTCDPSSVKETNKKTTNDSNYGACAIDKEELFTEHDIDYIQSQLPNPVDPQLIRDTLNDNHGDIDGAISYLLALNIPITPQPNGVDESNDSLERIMNVTGIFDVELVQQSFTANNLDVDSTIESLLKLSTNEVISEEEISEPEESTEKPTTTTTTTTTTKTKARPVSIRQLKIDKKKAKKQRATEKHRAQILATSGKTSSKQSEQKTEPPTNNEEEPIVPANMEFIRI